APAREASPLALGAVSIQCVVRAVIIFFFSSRRRHTRLVSDWSSDVCSSDLHSEGAQPGRLHIVLLLPVAGARVTAGLVQVGAVPVTRSDRSPWRSARVWNRTGRRCRNPGVGQHSGDPLPRIAGTAGRY